MAFERETIVTVAYCDIAGQVRGKGFPARDLESRRRFGVGWTPTNIMINCFNAIPATPFGAEGDLMLVPVEGGDIRIDLGDGSPAEHIILGDVLTMAGTPWACCPRGFLKRALDDLEAQTGFRLLASFEHEFMIEGGDERPGDAYAASKLRGYEPFIGDFVALLRANDIAPDTFLPEYGPRQFEITIDPSLGLTAADQAVKLREICRSVGLRHGHRVTFSPVVTPGAAGNGVHIHFSLLDAKGEPATYDPKAPGGMSSAAASFAAGVLRHAKAICAVTAPGPLSYERLKPHSWSAYYANIADRDREAFLRICPYPEVQGVDIAKRFNIEFRGSDASASPYLQLGMLVRAGLQGLLEQLPAPTPTSGDPGRFSDAERAEIGVGDLPRSLGEALDALEADAVAMGWLGPVLGNAYLLHKRGELATVADAGVDELARLYARVY